MLQCVAVCCSVLQGNDAIRHKIVYRKSLFVSMKACMTSLTLQHTAAHCSTLQHTATHYTTLHHTATHCNTLQRTATQTMPCLRQFHVSSCHVSGVKCQTWRRPIFVYQDITLQHTATHCNSLQHTATHCTYFRISGHHTATHGNTLQLTATHCNSLHLFSCIRTCRILCEILNINKWHFMSDRVMSQVWHIRHEMVLFSCMRTCRILCAILNINVWHFMSDRVSHVPGVKYQTWNGAIFVYEDMQDSLWNLKHEWVPSYIWSCHISCVKSQTWNGAIFVYEDMQDSLWNLKHEWCSAHSTTSQYCLCLNPA